MLGQIVSKRMLWIGVSGTYGAIVAFGPMVAGVDSRGHIQLQAGQHPWCPYGWTFVDNTCFKYFDDERLGWAEAEIACQAIGPDVHIASVINTDRQRVALQLAYDSFTSADFWIGLSDPTQYDEYTIERDFQWSGGEPLEYTNWGTGVPDNKGGGRQAVYVTVQSGMWNDDPIITSRPYICAQKAIPNVASGGQMLGCEGGRWMMGRAYKRTNAVNNLMPIIVDGVLDNKIYDAISDLDKISVGDVPITTAAMCATIVRRDYVTAYAVEYDNLGGDACSAILSEVAGVIYDPTMQTCIFDS